MVDSKGEFLSFFAVRRTHQVGHVYRNSWHLLCTIIYNIQVPHVANLVDRFRDWVLPDSSSNWWTASTKQLYLMMLSPISYDIRCNKWWGFTKCNKWWLNRLHSVWMLPSTLKFKCFLWRLCSASLPLGCQLLSKGFTKGICSRCGKCKETYKHAFWYCPSVKEWWNQLLCHIMHCFGYKLTRFSLTFGTFEYADSNIQTVMLRFKCWFLWFIWITRNKAIFENQRLYVSGLPWKMLHSKLLEDCHATKDSSLRHQLLRIVHMM